MVSGWNEKRNDMGQKDWDNMFVSYIESSLNDTVKGDGSKHFHSIGNYYGFGTIAKYNLSPSISSYGPVKYNKNAV